MALALTFVMPGEDFSSLFRYMPKLIRQTIAARRAMKKLPLGIPALSKIIPEGYAYVDKSRFVHELVESGSSYFLSRPRRFGKSLFVDTLKEAFEGNRELFHRLWLEDHWNWETRGSSGSGREAGQDQPHCREK